MSLKSCDHRAFGLVNKYSALDFDRVLEHRGASYFDFRFPLVPVPIGSPCDFVGQQCSASNRRPWASALRSLELDPRQCRVLTSAKYALRIITMRGRNRSERSVGRTLSEVVSLTGAKRRSVQIWGDRGVIQPVRGTEDAGTGVHRQFSIDEVRLVALLAPLSDLGLPVGWLRYFSAEFRKALHRSAREHRDRADTRELLARALHRAVANEGRNYLLFTHKEKSLWFEVITDDERAPIVNLGLCFEAPLGSRERFMGVLDLNACLRGLGD